MTEERKEMTITSIRIEKTIRDWHTEESEWKKENDIYNLSVSIPDNYFVKLLEREKDFDSLFVDHINNLSNVHLTSLTIERSIIRVLFEKDIHRLING